MEKMIMPLQRCLLLVVIAMAFVLLMGLRGGAYEPTLTNVLLDDYSFFCPETEEWHSAAPLAAFVNNNPRARNTLNPEAGRIYTEIHNGNTIRVAYVDRWSWTGAGADGRVGFLQAYNSTTQDSATRVDKIVMLNHINSSAGVRTAARTQALEIDGQGFTFRRGNLNRLVLGTPPSGQFPEFHMHNIFIGTHGNTLSTPSYGYNWGFIAHAVADGHIYNTVTPNWSFRIGNMATVGNQRASGTGHLITGGGGNGPHDMTLPGATGTGDPTRCFTEHTFPSNIARLIRGNGSQLTIYGNVSLNTNSENFYIGKVLVEDEATYIGHNNWRQYSTVWFIGNGLASTHQRGAFPLGSTSALPDTGNLTGIYMPDGSAVTDASFSFVVGRNARVQLSGQGTTGGQGGGFPAIYENYRNIIIGTGARFDVSQHSTSGVGFSRNGQQFIANPDSFVYLTSALTGEPIVSTTARGWRNQGAGLIPGVAIGGATGGATNASGLQGIRFTSMPGAQVYIIGSNSASSNTVGGIIHMPGGTAAHPNIFEIDEPKHFDFRNINNARRTGTNAGAPVFSRHGNFQIRFNNTDISLWESGGDINRSPDHMWLDVADLLVEGSALTGAVSHDVPELQALLRMQGHWSGVFNPALLPEQRPVLAGTSAMGLNRYRRIAAANIPPEFYYYHGPTYAQAPTFSQEAVTDANRHIQGRVVIGQFPEQEAGQIGQIGQEIVWRQIYAGPDMASFVMRDSHNTEFSGRVGQAASDGSLGWVRADTNTLQTSSGQDISTMVTLEIGGRFRDAAAPALIAVLDVTPPTPAEVDNTRILTTTDSISGRSDEPGAIALLMVNGTERARTIVAADGTWSFSQAQVGTLVAGTIVEIMLNDGTGPLEISLAPNPSTRNAYGNQNPSQSPYSFRNANNTEWTTPLPARDKRFQPAPLFVVFDVAQGPSIPLTKRLKMPTNTTLPTEDLKFSVAITPQSFNGSTDASELVHVPAVPSTSFTFDSSTETIATAGVTTLAQTANVFSDIIFDRAGTFVYRVDLIDTGYASFPPNHTVYYAVASYEVTIVVSQTGVTHSIDSFSAAVTTQDTPASPEIGAQVGELVLSSRLFQTIGTATDPALSITKEVTADFALPKDDFFTFEVSLISHELALWSASPTSVSGFATVVDALGNPVQNLNNPPNPISFTSATSTEVVLRDGQRLVFDPTVKGNEFEVREINIPHHFDASLTFVGRADSALVFASSNYLSTGRQTLQDSLEVHFLNNYTYLPLPTGLFLSNNAFSILLGTSLMTAVLAAASTRRRSRIESLDVLD